MLKSPLSHVTAYARISAIIFGGLLMGHTFSSFRQRRRLNAVSTVKACNEKSAGDWVGLHWTPRSRCTWYLDPEGKGKIHPMTFLRIFTGRELVLMGDSVMWFSFRNLVDSFGCQFTRPLDSTSEGIIGGCYTLDPDIFCAVDELGTRGNPNPFPAPFVVRITTISTFPPLELKIRYISTLTSSQLVSRFLTEAHDCGRHEHVILVLNAGLWDLGLFGKEPALSFSDLKLLYRHNLANLSSSLREMKAEVMWRATTPIFNPLFDLNTSPHWRLNFSIPLNTMAAYLNEVAVEELTGSSALFFSMAHVWIGRTSSPLDLKFLAFDHHHMQRQIDDQMTLEMFTFFLRVHRRSVLGF